jgi:hypothetical protein
VIEGREEVMKAKKRDEIEIIVTPVKKKKEKSGEV